jgi:phytoene dehydrogenase-like protein
VLGPLVAEPEHTVAVALGDKRSIPVGLLPGGTRAALHFGLEVLEHGTRAWDRRFADDVAPALLTGVASHAITPVPSLAAAGTALLLASLAHAGAGWPIPRGGSGTIVAALVADLLAHGGEIVTDHPVRSPADLPPAHCYLFDTAPRAVVEVFGERIPARVRRAYASFRHGSGAAKVDFVLSGPVPWTVPEVGLAGTVHVGGTRAEVAAAEADVHAGRHAERPVVLVSDPTVVDPGRASGGLRPLWTYAHVPAFSDVDVTETVTAHIERYAPGFRDVVVASRCVPAARMSDHDANYVGGDIAGGAATIGQVLARPTARLNPYATGRDGVYLCSASTPPGPGVHGLSGWYAARRVLREVFCEPAVPNLSPLPPLLAEDPSI